jgi:hypothetical protein
MRARITFILLALGLPLGLQAQIPPRRTLASNAGALRVLVATPAIEEGVDRAKAIDLAQGVRARLAQNLGGKYQMVSRDALNKLLTSSGYDADAPLSEAAVRALGTQVQAAFVFAGSIRQEADGRLTVSASLAPPSEQTPHRVTLTQGDGQDAAAIGTALAEQFKAELR